jgi:hypothetical protein
LEVCLLSLEEAGRLEHWGIWPKCKAHHHLKQAAAREGAEAGLYRFLGGEGTKIQGTVSMVVPVAESMWKPVQARNTDGSVVIGLRVWGLAPSR